MAGEGGSGQSELKGMLHAAAFALCCSWSPWKGGAQEGREVAAPPATSPPVKSV